VLPEFTITRSGKSIDLAVMKEHAAKRERTARRQKQSAGLIA